jgi:lipopolysaccharide/colanic/teichoic acid biosynthesis glycosyltransferase
VTVVDDLRQIPPAVPAELSDAPPTEDLVEQYRHMAHTHERRAVDPVLRALDVVISGTALVVLSPVLLVAALAVLTTGRPVLYRGLRAGQAGRLYTMYKFRTLRRDAEARMTGLYGPALTKVTGDEQTRVGRVLRATKIDELPQLINVLRGDMSMVGPRPVRPAFFEELIHEIPAYWQRLVVRPGITGFAQLRLGREESWAEKLAHDIEWIADRSVALYFQAIWLTALSLVRRGR